MTSFLGCCRKNLEDLDSITSRLRQKLHLPSASHPAEKSEDEQHDSSKPLSTSSALITCTETFGTEQLQGATHEWARSTGHSEGVIGSQQWGQSTDQSGGLSGPNYWGHSTNQSEGVPGPSKWGQMTGDDWVRLSDEKGLDDLLMTNKQSDLLSTQEEMTRDDVANIMQETLDNIKSQDSLSFGFEIPAAAGGASSAHSSRSHGTEDYSETLEKAQTLLKAIGQGTFTPKTHLIQRVGRPESDEDASLQEDERPEEDTFARVWQLRTEEQEEVQSSVSEDEEETVMMPKPLNDVSNVNFQNALPAALLPIRERQELETSKLPRAPPSLEKNDTDDTWFTDPQDRHQMRNHPHHPGNESGNASSSSRNFPLSAKVKLESSDTSSLVSRNLPFCDNHSDKEAAGKGKADLKEDDILLQEDPTILARVSRTSSEFSSKSQRSKNSRKAAMFRRERLLHRGRNSSSSSSDDEEVIDRRRPRSHRSRRSDQSASSLETSHKVADAHTRDDQIQLVEPLVISEAESGEEALENSCRDQRSARSTASHDSKQSHLSKRSQGSEKSSKSQMSGKSRESKQSQNSKPSSEWKSIGDASDLSSVADLPDEDMSLSKVSQRSSSKSHESTQKSALKSQESTLKSTTLSLPEEIEIALDPLASTGERSGPNGLEFVRQSVDFETNSSASTLTGTKEIADDARRSDISGASHESMQHAVYPFHHYQYSCFHSVAPSLIESV